MAASPSLLTLSAPCAVAVIGAGVSGLACAHELAKKGLSVSLFDKARGPGGRMSSKRRPQATLDLGAQAFTVRDPRFAQAVKEWQLAGCAALWPANRYQASSSGWQTHNDDQLRYAGAPRMSAITRHMAEALSSLPHTTLAFETPIAAFEKTSDGWQLIDQHGATYGPFAAVVVSAPPPQAYALVADWDDALAAACKDKPQRGCWAGWAIFASPLPPIKGVVPNWHTVETGHEALRLATRNSSKPGREQQPESISLLAQLAWSDTNIELASDVAAQQLLSAFTALFPNGTALPELIDLGAHRWRYAQPAEAGQQSYLYSEQGLALCGDSFRGSRVEDAWLSGFELAHALLARSVQ